MSKTITQIHTNNFVGNIELWISFVELFSYNLRVWMTALLNLHYWMSCNVELGKEEPTNDTHQRIIDVIETESRNILAENIASQCCCDVELIEKLITEGRLVIESDVKTVVDNLTEKAKQTEFERVILFNEARANPFSLVTVRLGSKHRVWCSEYPLKVVGSYLHGDMWIIDLNTWC